jgi:GST-like protein
MIDFYTWATPNGRKISIMLEELGLPYRVHAVDIGKGDQFSPRFAALNPNHKIPVIVDQDNGRTLFESGAILLYLAQITGRLGGADRWVTLQWLMLQMASVGPALGQTHHFVHFNPGKAPYAEERFSSETKRLYGLLNDRLRNNEHLAGDYSIADIATWPWISRFEWQQMDLNEFAHLKRWYLAIADRPAVQRGYAVPMYVNEIPRPASG